MLTENKEGEEVELRGSLRVGDLGEKADLMLVQRENGDGVVLIVFDAR
jgi:hypothetical protein